jgi:preprotein translocase subunit SecG
MSDIPPNYEMLLQRGKQGISWQFSPGVGFGKEGINQVINRIMFIFNSQLPYGV